MDSQLNAMLTTAQAAAYLGVSGSSVLRWRRKGLLPARRIGQQWRYFRHDLDHLAQVVWEAGGSAVPEDLVRRAG